MQKDRFGALMYSAPLMWRGFSGNAPVFKTGAFNHSATHPACFQQLSYYRETINIRKGKTVYRDDPTGGDAA